MLPIWGHLFFVINYFKAFWKTEMNSYICNPKFDSPKEIKITKVDTLSYKTLSANKESAQKEWLQVDASGLSLGRLASGVAKLARGKHKTSFTPHADCGDYVIVVNADKIELTGNKWNDKIYLRHTGYPGGQRSLTAQQLFDKDPIRLIEKAVKGMLPKNRLGAQILSNVYVYSGEDHPHVGQKPKSTDIKAYI